MGEPMSSATSAMRPVQAAEAQTPATPASSPLETKSTQVALEKMKQTADTVVGGLKTAKKTTVGFFKAITGRIGDAKNKAVDTIGKKQDIEITRVPETRTRSLTDIGNISTLLDKNSLFDEVLYNKQSSKEDITKAYSELRDAYHRLSPKDKEGYRFMMDGATDRVLSKIEKKEIETKNDTSATKKLQFNEFTSTEISFHAGLQWMKQGLDAMEKEGKIPKHELERMRSEFNEVDAALKENIQELSKLKPDTSDIEKLSVFTKCFTKNERYLKAINTMTKSYENNRSLFKTYLPKKGELANHANEIMGSLIAPTQRLMRYEMLMGAAIKNHSDPLFSALATNFQMDAKTTSENVNKSMPK